MIGKTYRDYGLVAEAAAEMGLHGIVIGGIDCQAYANEWVEMISRPMPYSECLEVYKSSKINLVILQEANGIYGLTSILDSFSVGRPMIVTRTSKLSMDVEKEGFGLEVPVGSAAELERAMSRLLADQDFYNDCVANIKRWSESHNSRIFAKKVCDILKRLV